MPRSAIATIGAGVQGDTTGALGADIIAFSQTAWPVWRHLAARQPDGPAGEWNRAYYGRATGARQIIMEMQASNPGADPLRDVLTRFGSGVQQAAVPPSPDYQPAPANQQQPPYGAAPTQLQQPGPVQQQSLPPPSRP